MSNIDEASFDPGVKPGEVLAGKYRVERILGVGGMGVVVSAHHVQLDEKVALKFLLPDALRNAEALARFEREARAAVKIKSEHVARVTDVGKLDNGSPYMVMEFLEGGDLSQLLQKQGPLPVEQAVDFVMQASEAIAEAHSLGIVHRDLKPSNLFCIRRRDGGLSVKVLDFGISKLTEGGVAGSGSRDMSMTKTTAIVGSPVYMSPEQMQSSKGVDVRTDIWALGVILFELVTGQVPFDGDTVTELAIHVATKPTPSLALLRAGLPAGLEPVISRCLEKSRDRRYQNVSELAAALVAFGTKQARTSLERIQGVLGVAEAAPLTEPDGTSPFASTTSRTSNGTMAAWQSTGGSKPGSRKTALGIGAVVAVAALVGAGALLLRKTPPPAAPTVAAVAPPSAVPIPPPALSTPSAPPAADSASATAAAAPPAADGPSAPSAPRPAPPAPVRPSRPGTPAAPPAAPASPAHCNPPYYFDAQGNRVFKKECL
jgi:serine/threonine-protein kinase